MKTVWRKAHDLLTVHDWTQGNAQTTDGCMCVGGAIAAALTGYAGDIYSAHRIPELELHLMVFADHVKAPFGTPDDIWQFGPEERVTHWNDHLDPHEGYAICVKALAELDELEKEK